MPSMRLLGLLALPAQLAFAQNSQVNVGPLDTLTLDQAIEIARTNNPTFQQTRNTIRNADAQVRTAYGALLPNASASIGAGYTQGGSQIVSGLQFDNSSDSYSGSYRISIGYNISAAVAYAPRAARANRRATEASIASGAELLRANVTTQYIQALQQQATAALNDTLVQTAKGQLDLATAKMRAGAGTILDVRQAEVQVGQAEVAALQAHNQATIAKLTLFQQLGIPADTNVRLTTQFALGGKPASLDSLLDLAKRVNPDLASRKSAEYAANMNLRSARTNYLPTLSLSTGIAGQSYGTSVNSDILVQQQQLGLANQYASCLAADSLRVGAGLAPSGACVQRTLSPEQINAIRKSNDPMSFRKAPLSFSAGLSLPLFNNFQREQSIESAHVQRDNATYELKARNIQLTNDVTTAYLNLLTALKTVDLQEKTAAQATEALLFAEQSYRVGAKTFLDVTTARGVYQQAVVGRINAIYDYHKAFAALENAVGRPLR